MARRQTQIPGTERPTIPEIEEVAKPLCEARYQRMELQKTEKALADQLRERMKTHKTKLYRVYVEDDEGEEQEFELKLEPGPAKVKIHRVKQNEATGGGDDGDAE